MRQLDQKSAIKAGAFVLTLLAILATFILIIGQKNSLFEKKINIYTTTNNSQGLLKGAGVVLRGVRVGTVTAINFLKLDVIRIDMTIVADYQGWIKKDSIVAIKTQGLLGDKMLEISGGGHNSPTVENNDHLEIDRGIDINHIVAKGETLSTSVERVLQRITDILVKIDIDKIQNSTTINRIEKISKNLDEITLRIQHGPGTMHSLIYDPSLYEDLRSLFGGAERNKALKYFIRESIKKSEEIKK